MENNSFIHYSKLSKKQRLERKSKYKSILKEISSDLLRLSDDLLMKLFLKWEQGASEQWTGDGEGYLWHECNAEYLGFKKINVGEMDEYGEYDYEYIPPTIEELRQVLRDVGDSLSKPKWAELSAAFDTLLSCADEAMPEDLTRKNRLTARLIFDDHYDYRYIQQVSYFIKKMITKEELVTILLLLDDTTLIRLFNELSNSANSYGQELYITLDEFNTEVEPLGLKWLVRVAERDQYGRICRDEWIDINSEEGANYDPTDLSDCSWQAPEADVLREKLSTNGIPTNFLKWTYGVPTDLSNEEELEFLRQTLIDVKTNFKTPYKIARREIVFEGGNDGRLSE